MYTQTNPRTHKGKWHVFCVSALDWILAVNELPATQSQTVIPTTQIKIIQQTTQLWIKKVPQLQSKKEY